MNDVELKACFIAWWRDSYPSAPNVHALMTHRTVTFAKPRRRHKRRPHEGPRPRDSLDEWQALAQPRRNGAC